MRRRTTTLDIAVQAGDWPPAGTLRRIAERAAEAAEAVLQAAGSPSPPLRGARSAHLRTGAREVSLLFTDDAAVRQLNAQWRGKDRPTNVLSFPAAPGARPSPSPQGEGGRVPLGDIALAAETVAREAALADKPLEDHIAHLIIHGFLHLLGYDHEVDSEAEEMERLERAALARLGIADPYAAAHGS